MANRANSGLAFAFLVLSLLVLPQALQAQTPNCTALFRSRIEPTPEKLAIREKLANRFRALTKVEGDMIFTKDQDFIFMEQSPLLAIAIRALHRSQEQRVSNYKTEDIKFKMTMSQDWYSYETRFGNRNRVDRKLSYPRDIGKYEGLLVYGTYLQYSVNGRHVVNRDFWPGLAYEKSENDPALGEQTGLRAEVRSFMGIIRSAQAIKDGREIMLQVTVEDADGQLLTLTSFSDDFRNGDILSIHEILVY